MKTISKLLSLAVLTLAFAGVGHAQTALTQTTLASAVNGPAAYNGTSSTTDQCITLASVTGIAAPTLPGTPVSVIYVGREAIGVFTVNTTGKIVCGFRGYLSTQAAPHASGDMVLISNQYSTTNQYGGNPLPSGFFANDPPLNGACTSANVPTTPWVNVLTGVQWICSSVTSTWVPGFGNPLVPVVSEPTAAVASVAGSTLPSGPLFHVTGTNAITGWTQPVGCNATAVGGCIFTVIPDAAFTWTTAGNIATAGTAVINRPIVFMWDAKNSKWIAMQACGATCA